MGGILSKTSVPKFVGQRFSISSIAAITLKWLCGTPLEVPVVPPVNNITAPSSPLGRSVGRVVLSVSCQVFLGPLIFIIIDLSTDLIFLKVSSELLSQKIRLGSAISISGVISRSL